MKFYPLMKKSMFMTLVFTCSIVSAQAGSLLIDTAPVIDPSSVGDQRCDGSISLKVIPESDIDIDGLEAYIEPLADTNVRFLIADNPQNTVLYYGPAVAVTAGTQWVASPAFNFTLQQGQEYEIAAMVEGCANFPWDQIPTTENGLSTTSRNGNPTDYAAPTSLGSEAGVDPRFRIFGGLGTSNTAGIPTIGTLGIVLTILSLLLTGIMARRKYSV